MRWTLLLAALALVCAPLALAQPALNYQFNETAGTTAANSGSTGATNDGTFAAAQTWIQPGATGSGAVTVAGTATQEMDTDFALTGASAFTIEFWVRTTISTRVQIITGMEPLTAGTFVVFLHASGRPGILATGAGGTVQFQADTNNPNTPVNDGTWRHVAFTFDGTDFALYIDGQPDPFAGHAGTSQDLVGTTSDLVLFQNISITGGTSNLFAGSLDDFRFWTTARTAQQIADNYAIELGQTTPSIFVDDPDDRLVSLGGSHRIDPVAPSGSETFEWTIRNVHPTVGLDIGTISIANVTGGTAALNAGSNPSNTTIAGGGSATMGIDVGGNAGIGAISFDVSIPNNDPSKDPYTFTVNGSRGLSGAFTIDIGGGADYDDIGEAFDDLNDYGVVGDVTFTVSGTGYTANASYELGSLNGADEGWLVRGSPNHSITFNAAQGSRPSIGGSINVELFTGLVMTTTIMLGNVHNITFEGFEFNALVDSQITVWHDPGIDMMGGPVALKRNLFHENLAGKAVAAAGQGVELQGFVFENNFVTDLGTTSQNWQMIGVNTANGFVPAFPGMLALFNAESGSRVEHNSFAITNYGAPAPEASCISMAGGLGFIEAMNYNIFAALRDNTKSIFLDLGAGFPDESDYNCFYHPNAFFSAQFASLTAWRNASVGLNLDGHSFVDDPEFEDTSSTVAIASADLHLQATSPCIGAATTSTFTVDFDGDTRPQAGTRDIGADERLGGGTGPGPGPANIDITTASLPDAIAGTAYDYASVSATASNTSGSYTWSLTGAPGWMSINGTGLTAVFGGTPPAPATGVTFTVNVEDAADSTINDSRQYTIDVLPAGTMVITTPDTLPNAVVGQAYPATSITVIGGTAPYTWSIQTGPSWMGVTGTSATASVINTSTVTPAQTGVNIIISVSDSGAGTPATRQYTIDVTNPPLPGGGGGGGGGGGCSISGGSSLWLIAIGAIGGFALLRRRRRVTA